MAMDKKILCVNEYSNECFITPFSLLHAISGAYMFVLLSWLNVNDVNNFIIVNFIHLLYEIKDCLFTYYYKTSKHKNSLFNSIGDQISCNIGIIIWLLLRPVKLTNQLVTILSIVYFIILICFWYVGYYKDIIG